ncbi:MAG TPA: hypothetical protein VM487_14445 [Phycisphaerae bacterium]|nr:hypothetical protein [Phycisphaerae bacterium]
MQVHRDPKTTVEELRHFPFETFADFQAACRQGTAYPSISRQQALDWAYLGGIYASRACKTVVSLWVYLPYIAVLGFIIYAVATGRWLTLLALPAFPVAFYMFNPTTKTLFGCVCSVLVIVCFCIIAWGFWTSSPLLIAFGIVLVTIWASEAAAYHFAQMYARQAAVTHEDCLCLLWSNWSLVVFFANGDRYSRIFETVGGACVRHDE